MSEEDRLTHFDERGNAVMVDVTGKEVTHRRAEARCAVVGLGAPVGSAVDGRPVVGWPADVGVRTLLAEARAAGIHGARETSHLIPLCHPLPLTGIEVTFEVGEDVIVIRSVVETDSQTGVEMEALTACAAAALTVADRLRASNPGLAIDGLALLEKSGGRSGLWRRDGSEGAAASR